MKTQIDIVSGFLGSGKTSFINKLLENNGLSKDRIVILQCETGEIEIDNQIIEGKNVYLKSVVKDSSFDSNYIVEVIKKYLPQRIIIEHNGMEKLGELLNTLNESSIRKNCVIGTIVHIIDAATFDVFMNNMGSILIEQISNSDTIVLNNSEGYSKTQLTNVERTLKAINKTAEIVKNSSLEHKEHKAVKQRKPSDILFAVFFFLVVGYFTYTILMTVDFKLAAIDLSRFQVINTVFLSILIQAFPFILFGVIISSIIQVFVSNERIVKFFPKKNGIGFIVAIFAGFLFPVCDCAIVPIAARLVKKGVPLPTALTFMIAAPIVNPLVIASTFYAFPGQPSIVFFRLFLGILIALAVGMTFLFFSEEKSVTLNSLDDIMCRCGYCGDSTVTNGFAGKVEAIFRHAGAEFFEVGRFLIIGAFLSSMVQTLLPKDILSNIGGGNIVSLIIMMLSAFLLSVCSTSDAFIARTFVNQFPMGAVMGFMIVGPMLDVKNLLMLIGNFKKQFVINLVFVIFVLALIVLSFFLLISVLFYGG